MVTPDSEVQEDKIVWGCCWEKFTKTCIENSGEKASGDTARERPKNLKFLKRFERVSFKFERGLPVVYYQICIIYYAHSTHNTHQDKMQSVLMCVVY